MHTFDEIANFISDKIGCEPVALTKTTTLQDDLGLSGLELEMLLIDYSQQFGVEISDYRWYFHTNEDGINVGSLFYRAPDRRVRRIPITIGMLHNFAQVGKWDVQYPEHNLPRCRIDKVITCVIMIILVVIAFLCPFK